jgi:hypothetical protein
MLADTDNTLPQSKFEFMNRLLVEVELIPTDVSV